MHDIGKRSAVLVNVADCTRLDAYIYIRSCNKMVALGYVYTLGKQILRTPERCTSWNATIAEFLEVQIPPHILVYDRYP